MNIGYDNRTEFDNPLLQHRAVIDPGCPGVGVAGQLLHALHGYVLEEQVDDHQDSETMG